MSIVTTLDVTNITGDQATLNGELTTLNGATSVDVWFEYAAGLTTAPQAMTTPGPFSAVIDGRSLGENVSYRAAASDGTTAYSGAVQEYVHAEYYGITTTDADFNAMTLSNSVYTSGGTLYLDHTAGAGTAVSDPDEDGDVYGWYPSGTDDIQYSISTNSLVSNSVYARELRFSPAPDTTLNGSLFWDFGIDNHKPDKMVFYVQLPRTEKLTAYFLQLTGGNLWIAMDVNPALSTTSFRFADYTDGAKWIDLIDVPHDQVQKVELVFDWTASTIYLDGGACYVYINDKLCGGRYSYGDGRTFSVKPFNGWSENLYAAYPPSEVTAIVDHDPVEHGFPVGGTGAAGTATSTLLNISGLDSTNTSRIEWDATTPSGSGIEVETNLSTDGGTTWNGWRICNDGGFIPELSGVDLTSAYLQVRITLTSDGVAQPSLGRIAAYAVSSSSESVEGGGGITYISPFGDDLIFRFSSIPTYTAPDGGTLVFNFPPPGTEEPTTPGGPTPGDIVDGDIFVGTLGDYDLFVANATWRVAREWASGALYGTDSILANISMVSETDPQNGEDNTLTLVSNFTDADAAQYCFDNGYFLPNKEELNFIYNNADLIDNSDTSGGANLLGSIASGTVTDNGYSGDNVWTSTECGAYLAWAQGFTDGIQEALGKYKVHWVVPVRRVLSTTSEDETTPTGTGNVFVKNSGAWKQATVFVNDGGVWKQPEVFINDDGTWKQC